MRRLLAAVAFLTRAPFLAKLQFDAVDVGRAALLFPAVGVLLGAVAVGARRGLSPWLPPTITAWLILGLIALATGAMHLDGLADAADGLGGGRSREEVLRIMRDHAIGAYGAIAVVVVLGAKAAAIGVLVARGDADQWLVVALALGRWGTVPLACALPYARSSAGLGAALTEHVGKTELLGATLLAAAAAVGLAGWRGAVAMGAVATLVVASGAVFRRRIGGVTGDTLGASTELGEMLVLVLAVGLR